MKPILGLTKLAGIRNVMMDAEGATVNLCSARHNKFSQRRFKTIALNSFSQFYPWLHCCGVGCEGVQSLCHHSSPLGGLHGLQRYDEWRLRYVTYDPEFSARAKVKSTWGQNRRLE